MHCDSLCFCCVVEVVEKDGREKGIVIMFMLASSRFQF